MWSGSEFFIAAAISATAIACGVQTLDVVAELIGWHIIFSESFFGRAIKFTLYLLTFGILFIVCLAIRHKYLSGGYVYYENLFKKKPQPPPAEDKQQEAVEDPVKIDRLDDDLQPVSSPAAKAARVRQKIKASLSAVSNVLSDGDKAGKITKECAAKLALLTRFNISDGSADAAEEVIASEDGRKFFEKISACAATIADDGDIAAAVDDAHGALIGLLAKINCDGGSLPEDELRKNCEIMGRCKSAIAAINSAAVQVDDLLFSGDDVGTVAWRHLIKLFRMLRALSAMEKANGKPAKAKWSAAEIATIDAVERFFADGGTKPYEEFAAIADGCCDADADGGKDLRCDIPSELFPLRDVSWMMAAYCCWRCAAKVKIHFAVLCANLANGSESMPDDVRQLLATGASACGERFQQKVAACGEAANGAELKYLSAISEAYCIIRQMYANTAASKRCGIAHLPALKRVVDELTSHKKPDQDAVERIAAELRDIGVKFTQPAEESV
jgi:hypothetical protein